MQVGRQMLFNTLGLRSERNHCLSTRIVSYSYGQRLVYGANCTSVTFIHLHQGAFIIIFTITYSNGLRTCAVTQAGAYAYCTVHQAILKHTFQEFTVSLLFIALTYLKALLVQVAFDTVSA